MEKKYLVWFIVTILLVVSGCRKSITVSFATDVQEVAPLGSTHSISLKSNGEWELEENADWFDIAPMSGSGDATLTLVAQPNITGEKRTAVVKATTKNGSASLTVSQDLAQHYIVVSPKTYSCGAFGGDVSINVVSNIEWEVSTPQWITTSVAHGSNNAIVTLSIAPLVDELLGQREFDVYFGNLNVKDKVHVFQNSTLPISVSPSALTFENTGGTKNVAVTCEGNWSTSVGSDWVTLSNSLGQGNAQVAITAKPNLSYHQRETLVIFNKDGGGTTRLTIQQAPSIDPHFLEVSPSTLNFVSAGGTNAITISCDTTWRTSLESDWVSLSAMSGHGNGTINITALPNLVSETRSTVLKVVSGTLTRSVTIIQEAGTQPVILSLSPDTLRPSYTGGFQHMNIVSNTSWELEASNWISQFATSGNGNASFDFVVDMNSGIEERIGYVKAKHNGQVKSTMVVLQEGRPNILETNITEIDARQEGGVFTIRLTANQQWVVENNVDWVKCSPLSGYGNKDLTVVVAPMSGISSRTGYLKINGSIGAQVLVKITQHN